VSSTFKNPKTYSSFIFSSDKLRHQTNEVIFLDDWHHG
jgi:hypothetical protein